MDLQDNDIRISKDADVRDYCITGSHVSIDKWVYCSVRLEIYGNYVHIAPFSSIIGGTLGKCIMGHFTGISAGGRIICASDDFVNSLLCPIVPIKYRSVKGGIITLKDFSLVGTNAVVMPNITMAEGSVLGAGAVLTHDTEPWTVYVGIPARPVKTLRNKKLILDNARKLGWQTTD
jgi:dTDP-4-amino-4,6-dideoxy-D-glucose acyltransferase